MTTCAALLAAGAGSRFRGPGHKLTATLRGAPVWRHALDHLCHGAATSGIDHVVVVTGAVHLDVHDVAPAAVVVPNPSWAEGQATSVRAAIAAAEQFGCEYVVIGLADQPFVSAEAWAAIAGAPASPITIASYDGQPGPNPVRLHRDVWPRVPTHGDEGARPLLRAHPDWVRVVPCLGSAADIDTLEDLDRWKSC